MWNPQIVYSGRTRTLITTYSAPESVKPGYIEPSKVTNEVWDELHRTGKIALVDAQFPRNLPIKKGARVLDIGCGEGMQLSWLCKKRGAAGVGIDVSSPALQESKKYPNINVMYGKAEKIPFPDNHFDFVYSLGLFEHFEDSTPLFLEAHRVLREGGYAFITVPNKLSIWTILLRPYLRATGKFNIGYEQSLDAGEIAALFKETGFHSPRFYKIRFTLLPSDTPFRRVMKKLDNRLSDAVPSWSFFIGGLARKSLVVSSD